MREIEVKYRVDDVEDLLTALKVAGVHLGEAVRQVDQAYAPATWSYGDSKLGVSFVRLRTVDSVHTFTLKRPAENALACDEFESVVVNRDEMHEAILAMSFRPTVRIAKTRRSAQFVDLTLCVDDVDGLGTFLEVERLVSDDEDGVAVQADLAEFVSTLGVVAERTTETYDSLIRARQTAVESASF